MKNSDRSFWVQKQRSLFPKTNDYREKRERLSSILRECSDLRGGAYPNGDACSSGGRHINVLDLRIGRWNHLAISPPSAKRGAIAEPPSSQIGDRPLPSVGVHGNCYAVLILARRNCRGRARTCVQSETSRPLYH